MTDLSETVPPYAPERWREGTLRAVLRVAAGLGLLVGIPSIYQAWREGLVVVVVADTVVIGLVSLLALATRWSYAVRAWSLCVLSYALGLTLLINVGLVSQIYLFGFSLLTALLLGSRAGFAASVLNTITLLVLGLWGYSTGTSTIRGWNGDMVGWLVITLNFALINTLLTVGIGGALSAVDHALRREIAARISLDGERTLLRTLVDALPDVVFTKDRDGHFTTGNKAGLALLGLERETQSTVNRGDGLYDPAIADSMVADDLEVLRKGMSRQRESVVVDATGKVRTIHTIKVPLHDAAGNVSGLLGIGRDITDRKAAEAERDQLLAQLQLQIARMPMAYIHIDRDGLFTHWNPAAERIFGYTAEEALGRSPLDLLVPEADVEMFEHMIAELRAGNMDAHRELSTRTRDEGLITCEWHNTPLFDEQGQYAGVLSLAVNVTERHKLEQRLRQAQKMEAVGKLAGGVAHDFNNLLTVIFGCSEDLLAELPLGDPRREAVVAMNEAGQRAAALTRQLLAFSRQSMLRPRVVDLNAIVSETGGLLKRIIGEDVHLTMVLDPALRPTRLDPAQLDQVLMNLAINARDAMPHGGQLTIETANVDLSAEYAASRSDCTPGPHVMLAITDTGTGMTPEVQSRIFEPFVTTKAVGRGTGLGLATVFGIVQQSGGCIHVYSEVDLGTTFKVYFPTVALPVDLVEAEVEASDSRGTETLLLVEDDAPVRELAFNALRERGYRILTAVDGADALRVVAEHDGVIDLLLTDVVMPNASGPELATAIRQRYPDVRVLFMSGYTDDAVVRHGLLAAEVAFLQKPYAPSSLAQRVRETLDQRSA